MKGLLYWLRWLLLVPAYFLGLAFGPLLLTVCEFAFNVDWFSHLNLYYALGFGWSAFAVTLLCAGVAPAARKQVGIAAGAVCIITGMLLKSATPQNWQPASPWLVLVSYGAGVALAVTMIFLLSKRLAQRG